MTTTTGTRRRRRRAKKEEEESEDEEVSDEDDDEEEEEEEVSDEDDDDDLKAIERANEKMGGEIRAHKEALGKLKETDPEFYEFLREEDSELLDFDEVSDDEDEDEDDLSDDEDDTTARKKAKKRTLTTEIVKKLCENAEGGESLAGAKALFQAYRSACHYGDDENDGDEASVRLASSSAFHELVQYLSRTPMVFCVAYSGWNRATTTTTRSSPTPTLDGKRFNPWPSRTSATRCTC